MSSATEFAAGLAEESLRAFVDRNIASRAGEFDRLGRVPDDVLVALTRRGHWGAVLPVAAGGTGEGMVALGELHEEIGRGCSSVRSLLTVHSMVLFALHRWGSAEARRLWLGELVHGERLGAFCLTESGAGSDITAIAATARPVASGYVLDGHKRWVTGGLTAGLLLVFARAPRGITAFLVEADRPGVHRTPGPAVLGTRGSMPTEVVLTGCEVGPEHVVGVPGMGIAVATAALDIGRYSVASGCVGIIRACLDACVEHASRRTAGKLLKDHQLVQKMIAEMATQLSAARLLCRHAGELKDQGDPDTVIATCVAKYFSAVAAMRAASDAVQLHGAAGCAEDHLVARLFRDAKVMEIIEGSTQIQETLIAADAFRGRRPFAGLAGVPTGGGAP